MNDIKRPKGIPTLRVAASPMKTDMGSARVLVHLSAEDHHGIPSVVASLRFNPTEARAVAERLIKAAKEAEGL